MAKKSVERRCVRVALTTWLNARGWTTVDYAEGFQSSATIFVPLVAVHFLPGNVKPFQIGNTTEKLYNRVVQVDCYMESEDRADGIMDDVMDFFDVTPIAIVDHNSTTLGSIICQDSESIYGEKLRPNLSEPKILWWRSIIRCTMEAHYF